MNFRLHSITQNRVDHLMAGDWPLAFKGAAYNDSLEVMAVPLDREVLTA